MNRSEFGGTGFSISCVAAPACMSLRKKIASDLSRLCLESCRAGANPEKAHSTPSPGIDRQGVLGNPLRFILTGGQRHDITQAEELIAGYAGEQVLADKGYDSQEFREHILALGMTAVIPPRSNRKEPAGYDRHLYREPVECFINKIKHYPGYSPGLRNWTPDTWAFCISPPLSSGYAESTQPNESI